MDKNSYSNLRPWVKPLFLYILCRPKRKNSKNLAVWSMKTTLEVKCLYAFNCFYEYLRQKIIEIYM